MLFDHVASVEHAVELDFEALAGGLSFVAEALLEGAALLAAKLEESVLGCELIRHVIAVDLWKHLSTEVFELLVKLGAPSILLILI